jgi:hypothetical protein
VRNTFPGPILKDHDFRKSKSSAAIFPGKAWFRLVKQPVPPAGSRCALIKRPAPGLPDRVIPVVAITKSD